jgi:hypothetical protein
MNKDRNVPVDEPVLSVKEIMNKNFPAPADAAEKKEPIEKKDDLTVPDNKVVPDKKDSASDGTDKKPKTPPLPPDFDPLGNKDSKKTDNQNQGDDDPDVEELVKAIDAETQGNKKLNLTRFRTKLEKQAAELQTRQKAIDDLIAKGVIDADLNVLTENNTEEMKKELEAAYDKIGMLSLAHDPRFVNKYEVPARQLVGELAAMINEEPSNDDEKLEAINIAQMIASLPKAKRAAALREHVPEVLITDATLALRDFDKLAADRDAAMKQHETVRAAIEREAEIKNRQHIEQFREAIKNGVQEEVAAEGYLSRKPGNTEYNQFIDSIYATVDELFSSADPKIQAKAMTLGAMAPVYRGMFEETQRKLEEVSKELEQYKSGTLRVSPRSPVSNSNTPVTELKTASDIAKHIASKSSANYKK